MLWYNIIRTKFIGMWLSLVERLVWDQDAAGSNPVIPTKSGSLMTAAFFVYICTFFSKKAIKYENSRLNFEKYNRLFIHIYLQVFTYKKHRKGTPKSTVLLFIKKVV